MRARMRVSVRAAVTARQWAKAGLVLTLTAGCVTTPKEHRVTEIFRDAGEGLRLAVSVEKESAQQFRYHLLPLSYFLFWYPPLCLCDEWKIRRKESLVYRRGDAEDVVREEREVLVEATKTIFPWMVTQEMVSRQEAIFRYVLTEVDDARRNVMGKVGQEVLWDDALKACEQHLKADLGGEALGAAAKAGLVGAEDEALVRSLSKLPYTVERTVLPTTEGSAVVICTHVQVNGTGECQITTTTVTVRGSMPLVDPNAIFKVRVVRRFTAAKSGKLLGTVDDTYVLQSEQVSGDGVCQTLMK